MKNNLNHVIIRCVIVFAVVISLGVTAYALSAGQRSNYVLTAENNTVEFMQKEAVLTDSISEIKSSTNFENYGYKIEELSASELWQNPRQDQ